MNTTGNFWVLNLQDSDLKEVLELDLKQFPKPWHENDWLQLNQEHHLLYGWKIFDLIKGFALFARIPGDDTAHLLKICVDSDLKGSGEVQIFWNCCLENLKKVQVKSIYLEVESSNLRAITFYQKCGFITLRSIKGYYSNGGDALTMHMIM